MDANVIRIGKTWIICGQGGGGGLEIGHFLHFYLKVSSENLVGEDISFVR